LPKFSEVQTLGALGQVAARFRIIALQVKHRAHPKMCVHVIGRNLKPLAIGSYRLVLFAFAVELLRLLHQHRSFAGRRGRSGAAGA